MSEGRELRCYDYVNHPYPVVRAAVLGDTRGIFQRATKAASTRAEALVANLRVSVGALEVGVDITIRIGKVEETTSPFGTPATVVSLSWQAVRGPWLFPAMEATLSLYALSTTETQLDLQGVYGRRWGSSAAPSTPWWGTGWPRRRCCGSSRTSPVISAPICNRRVWIG